MALPGRNDPCPCGSGKKFKRCCVDRDPVEVQTLAKKQQDLRTRAAIEKNEAQMEAWRAEVDELKSEIARLRNFANRSPMQPEIEAQVRRLIEQAGFSDATPEDLLVF